MGSIILILFILFIVAWVIPCLIWSSRYPELRWDWSGIDTSATGFSDDFLWGVASAAHQVEGGCTNNNWSRWEEQKDPDGNFRIQGGQKAGDACDHWNRYEEDIQLIKDLGVGAYRFSIEWSKLEPNRGEFDKNAFRHYHEKIGTLLSEGIEPVVTLHHFTHPQWFQDLGAFEKEENLDLFIRFCERAFTEYQDKVKMWCTINEPGVFATMGYYLGDFPPGEKNLELTAAVMRNLLLAHGKIYESLKSLPGGDSAKIGIVKNIFQFDPYRRWYLPDWISARLLDRVYNRAIMEYLSTGIFRLKIPGLLNFEKHDPEVKGAGDFIGLNYYSHANIRFVLKPGEPITWQVRPNETKTDMPYAIYPEGFFRAIGEAVKLGLPVYITENGISDSLDDRRGQFISRYLCAMSRAIAAGADVRGYFYWSLMDNFEWAEGYDQKFGLYAFNPETQERKLREGSKVFIEAVKRGSDGSGTWSS